MVVGIRSLSLLLLAGVSAAFGADRGAWAVENPALAEGSRMCVSMAQPLEGMAISDVPLARAAFTKAHWLSIIYDWMPPAQFAAESMQLQRDFDAGYIWLPESEWRVPSVAVATDVKLFLNSVLLAKQRLTRPALPTDRAGRLERYRISAWDFPQSSSLLKGSAQVGYMSFTSLTGLGAVPAAGEVELRVEFELFGGVFSVVEQDSKAKTSIPLTYTPFIRIFYGPPLAPSPRS